jgi:hypothetical protein
MVKHVLCFLLAGVGMVETKTYAQSLFSPRAIGIAAYGPLVDDTRSFTDNPAGIVNIRDWDMTVATHLPTFPGSNGFVFEGFALGKRTGENFAAALLYSQGSSLEFAIPTASQFFTGSTASFDRRISYEEPFAAAVAYKFPPNLSIGVSSRYQIQKLTDTQYELDSAYNITQLPDLVTKISTWAVDLGLQWHASELLTFSAVGRNLARIENGGSTGDIENYKLPDDRSLEIGAALHPSRYVNLSAQYSTTNLGGAGIEWMPAYGLAFRSGAYVDGGDAPFISGVSAGVGWKYKFVSADIAFLHFISQTNRQGSVNVSDFDPVSITSVDLNRYTSDRVQLSVKAIFGNVRDALAAIEAVHLTNSVYPSAYESFAYRPIGTTRIKNISDKPIQARVRFYVEHYMDNPTESQPVYILPGEIKDIPVKAVFNDKVLGVERMVIREANVYVSATPAEEYDDKYATPVLIHGRNDWDGSAYSLRYFVTPDDPAVIRYTRDILLRNRDSLSGVSGDLESFQKAKMLFNAFAGKLMYVGDPKQSADYVQYPSETLKLRGGDCDDMTTCFSSLLNSIGISTAFIDVVPPEDSSKSHIYLLFDTGIDPRFGNVISSNAKRYVVRKDPKGNETVWIPIETTMITYGFEASWSQGAQEYFDDVEVGLGLIKGWVHVVDVY